jgi:hypothetical protein
VVSHDQQGREPVFVNDRPHPEKFGADIAHRQEERVARLFDPRDRHAFGRFAHGGDHRRIEGDPLYRQLIGTERRHEKASV